MSRTIGLFKLITGEEIITEFTESLDGELEPIYNFTAPRTIIPVRTSQTEMGLSMAPWFMTAPDDTFPVSGRSVITHTTDVPSKLEEGYIKETSSLDIVSNVSNLIK